MRVTLPIKLVTTLLISGVFLFIAKLAYTDILTVSNFKFIFDPLLSSYAQVQLKEFVRSNFTAVNIYKLRLNILEHFPYLSDVIVRKNIYNNTATICFVSERPLKNINSKFCITSSGKYLSVDFFVNHLNVPNLYISEEYLKKDEYLPTSLVNFIIRLSKYVYANYDVKIYNKDYIILTNKKNTQLNILTFSDNISSKQNLNVAFDLAYKKLQSRILEKKTNKNVVFADIRFKDQIIIFENNI